MKNLIQKIKENYGLVIVVLTVGLLLGWIISPSDSAPTTSETAVHEDHDHESEAEIWTCSMHPQIRMDHEGKCPICSMDLIPLSSMQSDEETANPNDIVMTESAAKLAAIQTMAVSKGAAEKQIYLQGKIQADERNIAEMTARFGGRIEKLFVNFTGQQVRKGEKLATIYSPELVTAQRELLEAVKMKDSRPSLYRASREKLKLWDLTDEQISAIENGGKPQTYFDILATISGTVMNRNIAVGDYVKTGQQLFQLINLSQVWVLFDAYESNLPWLKVGDPVTFTVQALPGKDFKGKISYIDPFLSGTSRVAKVRVVVSNPQQTLKPEMFVNGIVESAKAEKSSELLIPKSAVLWTGKRSVVYVKVPDTENPTFSFREIELGPETGNYYVVAKGLNEAEEVAVNGVFKIDAAAQLQGLPSMMNQPQIESVAKTDGFTPSETLNTEHAMFRVSGNCEMCKDRIETAAQSIDGVLSAKWEADKQMMHLTFAPKKTSAEAVQKAIAAVGHDTEKYQAPDSVYNELPGCCLYR
ncbi:efflux RND transporter periplasmic adaptor subunit [Mangrovibacterium marinum]|uniref:efflux RND transporter periplasmic adaptor subunit n=1 Tax=Mangrovibacterium marinum TaxID=1639118 RepID=UPI002A18A915|nr:efflux RND transporter periplasmic adaptor subunit [Mangrovibacterium marinum]